MAAKTKVVLWELLTSGILDLPVNITHVPVPFLSVTVYVSVNQLMQQAARSSIVLFRELVSYP